MSHADRRIEQKPFVWRYLEDRIRDYLADGGMPGDHAGRLAGEIIVGCATGADSLPGEAIGDHAFDEAQLRLESWHASRSEHRAVAA